jgi:hypothetical protein
MMVVGLALLALAVTLDASLNSRSPQTTAAQAEKALGGHTPHVGPGGSVIVDSLTWRVLSSHTARRIRNQYVGSTASGIYLIVNVAATNRNRRPVPLNRAHAKLEVKGAVYLPDATAVLALDLSGHKTLSYSQQLGPRATASVWIAFDVAPSAINSTPQVCLQGLASRGTATGCITTSPRPE